MNAMDELALLLFEVFKEDQKAHPAPIELSEKIGRLLEQCSVESNIRSKQ